MSDNIGDIYNFLQLSERIATAGQPTRAQYPAIAAAGYEVVINLALSDSDNALDGEAEIAIDLGLEYIHIPVIWEAPKLEDFQAFANALTVRQDRKLFIHCAANKRVSAFIYLYRQIYEGVAESIARQDLEKIWEPNEIWQNFIDEIG